MFWGRKKSSCEVPPGGLLYLFRGMLDKSSGPADVAVQHVSLNELAGGGDKSGGPAGEIVESVSLNERGEIKSGAWVMKPQCSHFKMNLGRHRCRDMG